MNEKTNRRKHIIRYNTKYSKLMEFTTSMSNVLNPRQLIKKAFTFIETNFKVENCLFISNPFEYKLNNRSISEVKTFILNHKVDSLTILSIKGRTGLLFNMDDAKAFVILKNSEKRVNLLKDIMFILSKFYANALAFHKSKRFATIDQLTQLYNKSYFFGIMKNLVMKDVWPLAVMMLDFDDFKLFNDTYGHQKGDILLKNVGSIINSSLNSLNSLHQNTVACRYGGEEFCILLTKSDIKHASIFADKLRNDISQVGITVSIGFALFKSRKKSYVMVTEADRCLYEAKRLGKNKVSVSLFD